MLPKSVFLSCHGRVPLHNTHKSTSAVCNVALPTHWANLSGISFVSLNFKFVPRLSRQEIKLAIYRNGVKTSMKVKHLLLRGDRKPQSPLRYYIILVKKGVKWETFKSLPIVDCSLGANQNTIRRLLYTYWYISNESPKPRHKMAQNGDLPSESVLLHKRDTAMPRNVKHLI